LEKRPADYALDFDLGRAGLGFTVKRADAQKVPI
jgi:hypothetical protein